ncbi:P-loop NTPase [candidate division CSSED10-310 bacterium]|uniref:P-loop NTPase n=1 Tax=candidate division CSSED10-310 bacterium TaxID=2855610 RepID=A0ABV6YRW6_UNCC1
MRILTVSSGKGGVGKTSFAINFALNLSRHGSTILIDLDTGTSSIRNSLDVPITRDLYHFFRKGYSLEQCVATLDKRIDPKNRFPKFGFIAGPKRMIEEITNFDERRRHYLIDSINSLKAKYVVLDLKAGLDANVLDFLPYSNTGILIFTPHLPAATMAASDMVKAVLFKKLRNIFTAGSPVYAEIGAGPEFYYRINELIDKVEDVYDDEFENLDAFLVWLYERLGDHRLVQLISNTVEYFRTYFVLNMFNEVKESYDRAVKPFVTNIVQNVSSRINIVNLGWIKKSKKIHEANCNSVPVLLYDDVFRKRKKSAPEIEFDIMLKSLRRDKRKRRKIPSTYIRSDPTTQLKRQLDTLEDMHTQTNDVKIEQNFDYITSRALYLLQGRRISDFGDSQLFKRGEILDILFKRGQ